MKYNKIKYWEKFYEKKRIDSPTDFAQFCLKYIDEKDTLLDIGCGNGRDSYFFADNNINVVGIDPANKPKDKENIKFVKSRMDDFKDGNFNILYSRFSLHYIGDKELERLLSNRFDANLFMVEARDKEDEPVLYKNHKRILRDGNNLLSTLINNDLEIIYYRKGRGMAQYKNEDPLVYRIIAKFKNG